MHNRYRIAGLLCLLLLALVRPAAAELSAQQRLVERARVVVDDFRSDPQYGLARVYVQNAYGVIIVPNLIEGGFIIGGKYGVGILLVRDVQSGAWSDPIFLTVGGASLGLQIGGQASDVLVTLMNRAAVDKLLDHGLKLGADASAALGPIGAGVGTGTTLHFGEDAYVFMRNLGLYAGIKLEGTLFLPRNDWNEAYYGRKVTPREIANGAVHNPQAQPLKESLSKF